MQSNCTQTILLTSFELRNSARSKFNIQSTPENRIILRFFELCDGKIMRNKPTLYSPLTEWWYFLRKTTTPMLAMQGGLILLGVAMMADLAVRVVGQHSLSFDQPVLHFFASLHTTTLDRFFSTATLFGSEIVLLSAMLVIVWHLFTHKFKDQALLMALGYGGALVCSNLFKSIMAYEHPSNTVHLYYEPWLNEHFQPWFNVAFPSGHSAQCAAFALALFMIVRRMKPQFQLHAGVALTTFVIMDSASRIYFHVHYPSGVLAGLILAVVWVLGVDMWLRWRNAP
jgi:membrane-associated phospholipid phosphatase